MFRSFLPALCLISVTFLSCQVNSHYNHSETIPAKGWDLNETLYFQDSIRDDVPEKICFEVNIRHSNLFPYQNLWLFIRTRTSDGTNRLDSINWKLSEPSGRWIGSGWGSIYSLTQRLPDLDVKKTFGTRWFSIEVQHGLKDETLPGIEDVGIHLFSEKN
jgi:gliding motility-associated lipoprotein GldH